MPQRTIVQVYLERRKICEDVRVEGEVPETIIVYAGCGEVLLCAIVRRHAREAWGEGKSR